ncbi:lytic transglycosylase domain-containing protein [Yersinia enterocolitica]|uniref:lytic transglycosylase domain-containing protein n=1 Tax=Yersinia TaxID=629 RepID=UPI0005E16502|nr:MULTISPECIES: lytic transglycosylase domain-containing protein [Yersinia]EKN3395599.1 lytic transglycosylase domain-containing protein [Yersinia enterocolitica]EKN3501162.1 lytic transglycosylase domain-containing protein [Yersinia enterocolitica]EKN3636614.1 lytic transglycosylase domain-containing protein [Yersinia enterocolitica]EKN3687176.1 lytic transglycosylase domain-containing protein [Yersinia enterocolitica]EKN3832510.1 lytic transglycosylase domain-containing protein [Yersinia en
MIDLPPLHPSEVNHLNSVNNCIYLAANHYQVEPDLLKAIILTEGTKIGQQVKNTNNSIDMSVMGINTIHLPELSKFNIDKEILLSNPCLNLMIGAWLLKTHLSKVDISDPKAYWRAIGNYNSKTPKFNLKYQQLIWNNLRRVRAGYVQTTYSLTENTKR